MEGPDARARWLVAVISFALVCYPPLLSFSEDGILACFRYFAADAFYYLTIAARSGAADAFTFDGTYAVNGFHPLWCWWLTSSFEWFGLDSRSQLVFTLFSSVGFTALGAALIASACLRFTRSLGLSLLCVVPGFYYWLVPTTNGQYGALWNFANGMETPLTLFFFGVLIDALSRHGLPKSTSSVLALSLLLTVLTLSRLDDVFLFVPFIAAGLWTAAPGSDRVRVAIAWVAIPTLVIGSYLAWNLSYSGAALPLSGASKASGLAVLRNGYALLTTLFPWADVARESSLELWGSEAWRLLQMVIPALAAAAWIFSGWRSPDGWRTRLADSVDGPLLVLAGYVLLKAGYNFVFVSLWHQGHWYYPASIVVFNVIAAIALSRTLSFPSTRTWKTVSGIALAVFLLVTSSTWASIKAGRDDHVRMYELWSARAALETELERICPGCGVLSFDDGIVAFALERPSMNGLGLVLDRKGVEARKDGRLLEIAHARRFRLLTSLNYPFAGELEAPDLRARLEAWPQLKAEPLEAWSFEIAHRDPASGAWFIRFEPASR